MSHSTHSPNWTDPYQCPFCDSDLADPGAGFVDHIAVNPSCETGFQDWRQQVAGDMAGGWSG